MENNTLCTTVVERQHFSIKIHIWPNEKCFDFEFFENVSDECVALIKKHIKSHEKFLAVKEGGFLHYSFRRLEFFMESCERDLIIDYLLTYIDNLVSLGKYEYRVLAILKGTATNYLFLLEKVLISGARFFKPFGIDSVVAFISNYDNTPKEFPFDKCIKIDGDHLRGGGEYEGTFKVGDVSYELYIPNTIPGIENVKPGCGMKSQHGGYLTAEGVDKARYATLSYNRKLIKLQKIKKEDWGDFLKTFDLK